jgi:hypothetical protein
MFMALHPCACGDERFAPAVRMTLDDGELVTHYAGRCRTCHTGREFAFRIDDEFTADGEHPPLTPGEPEYGRGPEPSEIIDAGQWLRSAERIVAATPSNILGVSEREWLARRYRFKAAAESVGEVLKFIPADLDDVPDHAFWTDDGRAERDRAPDRFRRDKLERFRHTCLELAQRYSE